VLLKIRDGTEYTFYDYFEISIYKRVYDLKLMVVEMLNKVYVKYDIETRVKVDDIRLFESIDLPVAMEQIELDDNISIYESGIDQFTKLVFYVQL